MPYTSFKNLSVENWGLAPYSEAFDRQRLYVEEILKGIRPQTLIFTQHPPVVTLGRGTREGDVFQWSGAITEVNRGGRATYHGPSQIVFYPLIHLDPREPEDFPCRRDLHGFIRLMESTLVHVLKDYGVKGVGHQAAKAVGDDEAKEATGVWVRDRKIASIGIAVRQWVSSHGMAFNLYEDPAAFQGINPCGFRTEQMTSLEKETGVKVDRDEVQKKLLAQFQKHLNFPNHFLLSNQST